MNKVEELYWHNLSDNDLWKETGSSEKGLLNREAIRRLKKDGPNELDTKAKKSLFLSFLRQFANPLIYVLIITAMVTYYLGHALDTYVIILVVTFNAIFGFFHELKADRAMEALKKMMALKTKVKRDGITLELPSIELVRGDIVELESGMKVPADLRIIEANNLMVDEAILTGESISQEKMVAVLSEGTLLGERVNMLFSGTIIISGKGLGLVVETGSKTQFGIITKEINQTEKVKTPLQIKLELFSKRLLLIIFIAVSAIFVVGLLRKMDLITMLLTALSMAISAIPEGLPAIVTITLATGAFKMSKRNAIVRKLMAVETLGSINVIASDKTGTLTHNQMTVRKIYNFKENKTYDVSGSGYEPKGDCSPRQTPNLKEMMSLALLCSDAEVFEEKNEWYASGDPTEAAVAVAANKIGLHKEDILKEFPLLDQIPFETEKGFASTLNKGKNGKNLLIVQGKIENILLMTKLEAKEKEKTINVMEEFAKDALRVIALAYKEIDGNREEILESDFKDLEFIGFTAMIDPPRKEAIGAIANCKSSGIRPVMITGDYSLTAKAVAEMLGIIDQDGLVISGSELSNMTKQEFVNTLKVHSVYARISPEQKLKIVEGLQDQGNIVAVTGDGINDAPALKKSDVGVAMGEGGTDASRETADLVLVDNNFATIVAAIEEGRTVFQNIKRAITYLLSTSFGELLIIFTAMLAFPHPFNLPLIPVQILWLNLVTDGSVGWSLALEPTHKGVINYRPRSIKENIMDKIVFTNIIVVSLVMLAVTFVIYWNEIQLGSTIERARTMAFVTMSVLQIFNVLNCRSLRESIFSFSFFSNKYILIGMLLSFLLTYATVSVPIMRVLFKTVPLDLSDWLKIISGSALILVVVEIEKWYGRQKDVKN